MATDHLGSQLKKSVLELIASHGSAPPLGLTLAAACQAYGAAYAPAEVRAVVEQLVAEGLVGVNSQVQQTNPPEVKIFLYLVKR